MKNIIRLIAIEYYKIKHHKLSRILFLSYFILLSGIALIASIKFNLGHFEVHLAEQGIFNFPYIWHFNTYVADILTFFLAIIVVSMVTNEYTFRTVKQNLIDGMTKKEFVLSKFYFLVLLSLTATFFVFVMTLILGLIYSDYTSPGVVFRDIYFLFAFFLKLLGLFSLIMFLGFLFRRAAIALGFFFIWILVEWISYAVLRWELFNKEIAEFITQFFPFISIKSLLPEPVTRLNATKNLGKQIGENIDKFEGIPVHNFLIVIIWILLFVNFSYKLLQKRDL